MNNEYNGLTFIADNWQEGEKEYKFTVVVNAYEKVSGSWKLIKNEPKFIKYTTGKRPDYIPEENVVSASSVESEILSIFGFFVTNITTVSEKSVLLA